MKKFWNWIKNSDDTRILRLEGPIDEESFWGDEITPQMFRDELESGEGDVTVWINSPGGNVFAAAEIYTMLKDYKGSITVKIDAIAASAASVVAMAGDTVQMSPVAMLMIHDPSTVAMGNTKDMEKAIEVLTEVKPSSRSPLHSRMQISRRSRMKPPLPRQKRISRWQSPMQRRKPRRLPLPQKHRQRQTANWQKACPIR